MAKGKRREGGNVSLYDPYAAYEEYWNEGSYCYGYDYGGYGAGYTGSGYGRSDKCSYAGNYTAKTTTLSTVQDMNAVVQAEPSPVDQMIMKIAQQRNKLYDSYEAIMNDPDRLDDCFYLTKQGYGFVKTRYIDGNKVMFAGVAKECPLFVEPVKAVGVYISNKIPKELFQEVLTSFYGVYKKYHKEASAQIWRYKDGDRKYFVVYPEQNISGASVSFKNDTEQMTKLRETADRIVDCHSHHSMGAFWSSVDDNDEQTADCFRMVMGCMSGPSAKYLLRVKFESIYRNFSATELFDMTAEEEAEILKTENIGEDNGEIYKYILDAGKVAHYTASRGGYTVNGGYRSLLADDTKRKEELEELLKTAPDKIFAGSEYYKDLWKYSSYRASDRAHISFDYVFESQYNTGHPSCWVRIKAVETAKKDENYPVTAEVVEEDNTTVANVASSDVEVGNSEPIDDGLPAKEEVTDRAYDYVRVLSKLYCGKETGSYSPSGSETTRLVDHLCGCTYDTTYNSGDSENSAIMLPGDAVSKEAEELDVLLEDETSAVIKNVVEIQASARVHAQENIEKSVNYFTGIVETPSVDVLESEFRFIEAVLETGTGDVSKTFSPSIMWELFTPKEKSKLATCFGVSVVDMGSAFGYASGCAFKSDEDRLSYLTVLILYKVILMPEECFVLHYRDFFMSEEVQGDGNPAMLLVNFNRAIKKL